MDAFFLNTLCATLLVITSDKGGGTCFCPCSFVCLSVSKITQKRVHGFGCVSTDVGTWSNLLTFDPDPDYSPDAGTGLLSPLSYKSWYAEFYVGENPTYTYWPLRRRMVLQWLYSLSQSAVKTPLSEVHALHRVPF